MQIVNLRIYIYNNKKTCFAGFRGTRIYLRFCYNRIFFFFFTFFYFSS